MPFPMHQLPLSAELSADLSVVLTSGPGDEVDVRLAGELDGQGASPLRDVLADVIDTGADPVVLVLDDLRFIDSTGVGVLVGACRRARSQGSEVVLESPTSALRKVFAVTGIEGAVPIR